MASFQLPESVSQPTLSPHKQNMNRYQIRTSVFDSLPIHQSDIVMLGDSLTENTEWHELFDNSHLVNRGIGSDTVAGTLARLTPLIQGQPRAIFIHIGVNDFKPETNHTLEALLEDYRRILTSIQIHSPQTQIMVLSVLPINSQLLTLRIDNERIRQFNQGLAALCEQLEVPFLNSHAYFVDEQDELMAKYTTDGLHLNGPGYQQFKQVLLQLTQSYNFDWE